MERNSVDNEEVDMAIQLLLRLGFVCANGNRRRALVLLTQELETIRNKVRTMMPDGIEE